MQSRVDAWLAADRPTIVGYTYESHSFCEGCKTNAFAFVTNPNVPAEAVLDRIALARGIDRHHEDTFNSDDFPKVITADNVHSDCVFCGGYLSGIEHQATATKDKQPR